MEERERTAIRGDRRRTLRETVRTDGILLSATERGAILRAIVESIATRKE